MGPTDPTRPERSHGDRPLVALMFPGQGAQEVGMGKKLAETFPIARETFDEANDVLGYDLARICFEGPHDQLMSTTTCQPAMLATSVAAWRVAQQHGVSGDLALGHSLGEYSALVACDTFSFEEAVRVVAERAEAASEVSRDHPGAMAALLGASDEHVEALCVEAGEVWPANYNCPGQVVASGKNRAIDRLLDLAHAQGIRARRLDIEGAFHSAIMAPATDRLRDALANVRISTPSLPFLSATSAALERGEQLRSLLAQQLTAPVRFTAAVRAAADMGADRFVEFGPRRVLVGLVRRISTDAETAHLGEPDDLPALAALAARGD